MRYVKLISERLVEDAPYEKDGILNYNCDANWDMMRKDGYRIFITTPRPETDRHYEVQYSITSETEISEIIVWTESMEEYNIRKLTEAKINKRAENNIRRNNINRIKTYFSATENGYLLKTTPVGDIMTVIMGVALPAMMAQQSIETGTFRYYDEEGNQYPSPEIKANFVPTFYQRFATTIAGIDAHSADIEKQINEAETIEEVNAIIIDYTLVGAS